MAAGSDCHDDAANAREAGRASQAPAWDTRRHQAITDAACFCTAASLPLKLQPRQHVSDRTNTLAPAAGVVVVVADVVIACAAVNNSCAT